MGSPKNLAMWARKALHGKKTPWRMDPAQDSTSLPMKDCKERPRGEKVAMPFSPHGVTLPGADVWAERIMSLWPWAAHLPIQGYVPLLLALILLPGEEPCLV